LNLLFDQNISPKIVKQLEDIFPEAKQVRHLGLEDASDIKIFEFAKSHGYAVVTFDSDFVDLNVLRGFPPKIIWLKTGNLTTKSISELIHKNLVAIQNFLRSEENEILELIKNSP
jgi:predicted nuclease of predicted toxin-antitoxin system